MNAIPIEEITEGWWWAECTDKIDQKQIFPKRMIVYVLNSVEVLAVRFNYRFDLDHFNFICKIPSPDEFIEIERLRQKFRARYFRKYPDRIDDERLKIIPCHCDDDTCYGWQATTDEIIEAREGLNA